MTDVMESMGPTRRTSGEGLDVTDLRIERARDGLAQTIVSGVSLAVAKGESIGIVGESGSGKSMTARAVTGLLPPGLTATGSVSYGSRNLLDLPEREWRQVRGTEIGLILQDPFTMLNPVLRCASILGESLRTERRLGRQERRAEVVRRLAEVGIHDPSVADRYPLQLSGGMRQRVAIAAALARDPEILIADEPSTALDVTTQRDTLALIKRIQAARGMGLVLITHDLRVAFAMCDRIYVLYAGTVVEVGKPSELDAEPLHPYTQGLLSSEPPVDHRVATLFSIPGAVPSPDEGRSQCVFAARCQWAIDACRRGPASLSDVDHGRQSACVRLPDIRADLASVRRQAERAARSGEVVHRASPLVRVERVTKEFVGSGRTTNRALDEVSLDIAEHECVGLVGESGSGKTTLARMLVGLERATAGTIAIDGIDASDWASLGRADLRRLRGTLQFVFQDPYSSLDPRRSVGWTIAEAITTRSPHQRNVRQMVGELLAEVGLPRSYAELRPVALSGGMRQRVAIARALAAAPRLLVCDEPVSALDVSVQAQILNLLRRLHGDRGLGYLFITHDLSIVRQISDYLYVMHRGRVVESGPTERVLDGPQHPYTVNLLTSVPRARRSWLISGAPPDLDHEAD
jgi:peptide/nickel transport system ATP-binding protein